MTSTPTDATVVVAFDGPSPQRRWTVALRPLLAIPHLFFALLVGVALGLATIVVWFAALLLGRLPVGMVDFLGGGVRYVANVAAYSFFLLTDRFPSFELQSRSQAVDVALPQNVHLNRAAVLFRIVLIFPVYVVATLLSMGSWILAVVAWLILLVTGRLPGALFLALAAIVRYVTRYYAFFLMLTSEYPRGLFGDRSAEAEEAERRADPFAADPFRDPWTSAAEVPPAPAPAPAPAAPTEPAAVTEWPAPIAGAHDPAEPAPSGRPRITRLVLSRGSKLLLVLALVVGAGMYVASFALAGVGRDTALQLEEAYVDLTHDADGFYRATQRCAFQEEGVACINQAATAFQDDFRDFKAELLALELPAPTIDTATTLAGLTDEIIHVLGALGQTTDAEQYDRFAGHLEMLLADFDAQVVRLHDQLQFS